MHWVNIRWLLGISLLLCCGAASSVRAQSCTHGDDPAFYERKNYRVAKLEIKSPFSFLRNVSHNLAQTRRDLPLQTGQSFVLKAFNDGVDVLRNRLQLFDSTVSPRSRLNLVVAQIARCKETDTAPEVELVYWVFSTNAEAHLFGTWEFGSDRAERAAMSAADRQVNASLKVQPFLSYNRTTHVTGGAHLDWQIPGGVFERLRLAASGSREANQEELELTADRSTNLRWLNRYDYRFGYRHLDIPAGTNRLRSGSLYGQFAATTKPLGRDQYTLRYGMALSGGNQQTDLPVPAVVNILADSATGQLKSYVGLTRHGKATDVTASYALLAGAQGATLAVDYVKHLADVGLNHRWRLRDPEKQDFHPTFDLEWQFTLGKLQQLGRVPVTERFFGGNVAPLFLTGDEWRLRSGPLLRSIPQYRWSGALNQFDLGSTGFFSSNLTLARTVWGQSLVPREVARDAEFRKKLDDQRRDAEKIIAAALRKRHPELLRFAKEEFGTLESTLKQLQQTLATLPENTPDEIVEAQEELDGSLELLLASDLADKTTLPTKLEPVFSTLGQIVEMAKSLSDALQTAGLTEAGTKVQAQRESIRNETERLKNEFQRIDLSALKQQAADDLRLLNTVLDTCLDELNLFALSPVAIFDVARLWPDQGKVRYAIGGGLRLSLVNFQVTLGYAFNPQPRFNEGRGALFFSMDVKDLFR